ncbi:MAG: hypothetical protein ABR567_13315 [Myxococcales bacterium]|nr:hypothetical protein [Myxococcales bacterium]
MSAVADALRALDAALRSAGARWYLFGAQAALVHGASRLTADIDATVAWEDASRTGPLIARLRAQGFVERPVDADFTERTRVVPLEHAPTAIPVDLVLGGPGPEELFLSRAREHDIDGVLAELESALDRRDLLPALDAALADAGA